MVKDRKELATFDLGKLKAFFDRDTAMVWPETVTAERAEAGRVQRVLVTQWSHVTCYTYLPNLFNHRPTSCHNRVSCSPHTMVTEITSLPLNTSDRTLSPSSTRRLSYPGVGRWPKYGLRRTWNASCQRHRPSKLTSRNPSVSLTC